MNDRIKKYYQKELSVEERISLLNEAETNHELKEKLIQYQQIDSLLSLSTQPDDEAKAIGRYSKFKATKNKRQTKKLFFRYFGYAASVILLICGGWIGSNLYRDRHIVFNQLYVPPGQRACLTLSDGSEVWINANSTFIYPTEFGKKERRVTLVGEGFFDVVKDSSKPFIVSTQSIDIRVLGTKFDVYCYPGSEYITTSLLEGIVKVYEPHKESEGVELTPNKKLYYANGSMHIEDIEDSEDFLWRNGIYGFEKESFDDILKKLELYYDVTIHVNDSSILDFDYTAKFRQRDGIDEILRQIQKTQQFTIEKDYENNIITLNK